MKMNLDAIKALELKLAEYDKENAIIAEHESADTNLIGYHCSCSGDGCYMSCDGSCKRSCSGSCDTSR